MDSRLVHLLGVDRIARPLMVLLACLALLAAACSSSDPSPTPSSKPSSSSPAAASDTPDAAQGDLAGTWSGTIASNSGDGAPFTVEIKQDGSNFTGQLRVPAAICNKEATVSGSLSGSKINFGVSEGSDLTGNFEGTVEGTAMSGTWSSPAGGACGADGGTWTAKKNP